MKDEIITKRVILGTRSKETTMLEVRQLDLKERIKAAIPYAWIKGYGLAAIQIGVPLQYAWFQYDGREYELINPHIIFSQGFQTKTEGCLSIPDKTFDVPRSVKIEYINDGKKKRAKGKLAQIIQHEIDHMNGILISDYETT